MITSMFRRLKCVEEHRVAPLSASVRGQVRTFVKGICSSHYVTQQYENRKMLDSLLACNEVGEGSH